MHAVGMVISTMKGQIFAGLFWLKKFNTLIPCSLDTSWGIYDILVCIGSGNALMQIISLANV